MEELLSIAGKIVFVYYKYLSTQFNDSLKLGSKNTTYKTATVTDFSATCISYLDD